MSSERFFLDQDYSGHWYIIPVSRRAEWSAWTELAEDDEAGWEAPAWTEPVGGGPGRVSFTCPIVD